MGCQVWGCQVLKYGGVKLSSMGVSPPPSPANTHCKYSIFSKSKAKLTNLVSCIIGNVDFGLEYKFIV